MSSFPAELHSSTPPAPPPKGGNSSSSISTPTIASPTPPLPPGTQQQYLPPGLPPGEANTVPPSSTVSRVEEQLIADPGETWLPSMLRDKSTQDLADILANPALLNALALCTHESIPASNAQLLAALEQNMQLATHVSSTASRLAHQRSSTQAQLLATHALERQWRQKQSDMDHALAPFSPASLYQQLAQGVQEQALVCQAMEESFLEAGGGLGAGGRGGSAATAATEGGEYGGASKQEQEREVNEWIRKYREAKVLCYLRQERKERWDEGRVGGWR
ncbi:Modifier of rudimentary, Modr [Moelleriella libera RCEF 2490]|uniref:Modifier of rudimentary, Modr n=1 Tax=Moelleriella libera RCEF 2490 TaxID=1081109 RepID=A0A168B5I9_9HYPO|nr:Modifier of rudimentary, Modr [Moelleriella libera RCEF 2490]